MRNAAILIAIAATAFGCKQTEERFCDEDTPCKLAEFPYCDLNGEISGTENQCIPMPDIDASVPDASIPDAATSDAGAIDASLNDAFQVGPGLGQQCTNEGTPDCPTVSDCLFLVAGRYAGCKPRCSVAGADEECAAVYSGVAEPECLELADGPRCVLKCSAVGACDEPFICRTDFALENDPSPEDGYCVPLDNALGQSCDPADPALSCPAGNLCFDPDDEPGTPNLCGPDCSANPDVCSWNSPSFPSSNYPPTCVELEGVGYCAVGCDPGDESCPAGPNGDPWSCIQLTTGDKVCMPPYCGNGVQESGEECDDGNDTPGDGCEADCSLTQ